MNEPIILRNLKVEINRENVFRFIDCFPDSPVYQEVEEEYERIIDQMLAFCKPVTILFFDTDKDTVSTSLLAEDAGLCYGIYTIGNEISEYSTRCFQEGEYLAGLLSDAIANEALFQLDRMSQDKVKEECAARNVGVSKRLEAPEGIPMEMQRVILEKTKADKILGIGLTEGLMYTTVKTNGFLCILTADTSVFQTQHDCASCSSVNCKMRVAGEKKITEDDTFVIDVEINGQISQITCKKGETLLNCLQRNGITIAAYCSGRGTCGKCKVQVTKGTLESNAQEALKLSTQELERGIHLACLVYPKEYCCIRIMQTEDDFDIVTTGVEYYTDNNLSNQKKINEPQKNTDLQQTADPMYAFAIDIGTTTLAISLLEVTKKRVLGTYTCVNSQRSFGADVISRIVQSNEGKGNDLKKYIQTDLENGMRSLAKTHEIAPNLISDIAIAGNTTMQHLLLGYSCKSLGVSPFAPVNISYTVLTYKEVFESTYFACSVHMLPGFSTFVGADITAGMTALYFQESDDIKLLVDLGTNGEMALGNKSRLLVTSTAAGPAFEGGNISCGTGSIPGAISSVSKQADRMVYETIQNKPPIGICGTGVLEITAELIRTGLVDETGLLEDEYFEKGYLIAASTDSSLRSDIRFTQKDIREIQLAKAAVRGGIETLITKYGCRMDQIAEVYLAGGFGTKMNIEKAVYIGLFPKELQNKIKAVGNSSLSGAILFLYDRTVLDSMKELIQHAKEMNLANEPVFQEAYITSMYFESAQESE